MKRHFLVTSGLFLLAALLAAATFLYTDWFRATRLQALEQYLSKALRYPVEIDGDVRLALTPRPVLTATRLRIPAAKTGDPERAILSDLRVHIDPSAVFDDELVFPRFEAIGLELNILLTEPGATNWRRPHSERTRGERRTIVDILEERDVDIADARVFFRHQGNGFDFDFALDRFVMAQPADGHATTVLTKGTLNSAALEINGAFEPGEPVHLVGQIGEQEFSFKSDMTAGKSVSNFAGQLSIDSNDLADLMDILQLNAGAAGSGTAKAKLHNNRGQLSFDDLDITLQFDNANTTQIAGWFHSRGTGQSFDVQVKVDLTGEKGVPTAVYLGDIRAGQVAARVVGEAASFEIVDIEVLTNAFDSRLSTVGPFRIDKIQRTADNNLEVVNFFLELGPPDAPYLVAQTDIENIFDLSGLVVEAQLDLPPEEVFQTLSPEVAAALGHLKGSLDLTGSLSNALPTRITLDATDTSLWSGQVEASTPDLFGAEGFTGAVSLSVPDGSAFFSALHRRPLNVGTFGLQLSFEQIRGALVTDWALILGASWIEAKLTSQLRDGQPIITGTVRSPQIGIPDLSNGALAATELVRLISEIADRQPDTDDVVEHKDEFQPLVLPEPPAAPGEDLSDFQPLVLSSGLSNIRIEDLGSFDTLKRDLGVDVLIDVQRLIGQQGLSGIKSRLRLSDGLMRFGPLYAAYGGGQAVIDASMNIVSSPRWLQLSGRAGGWQLADVLRDVGLDFAASGVLNATFDLSGPTRSIETFTDNMQGQATIEMRNGRIGTSLIELAGLGVIPWLFSREKARGYANISCITLPLNINGGKVTTDGSVLETERVQLLSWGSVDWVRDHIDLKAEPRPVGQPLARSAWPFSITGALSDPQITRSRGRVRRPNAPLAMPERRVPCVPDYRQLVDPLEAP